MSHEIGIRMGGYIDENNKLMNRTELDKRIAMKDERIKQLEDALRKIFNNPVCAEYHAGKALGEE